MAIMATHPTAAATIPGTVLGPPTAALLGVPNGVVVTVVELASVVGVGVVVELSVSDLLVEVVVFLAALVFVVLVAALSLSVVAVMVVVPVLVVDSVLVLVALSVALSTSSAFLMLNPGEYARTDSSELSTILMPYSFSSPSDFLTCHLYLRCELSMPANLNSVSRAGVK